MKKRLVVIVAIPIAVLGAIVIILALIPAKPGVTKANFNRLDVGMTRNEVEAVFGGPCNEGLVQADSIFAFSSGQQHQAWQQAWQGVDGFALVKFNENSQVEETTWHQRAGTIWDKLRRMLP